MTCKGCHQAPATYDAPDDWCEFCWAKWWYEGCDDEQLREEGGETAERELARRGAERAQWAPRPS